MTPSDPLLDNVVDYLVDDHGPETEPPEALRGLEQETEEMELAMARLLELTLSSAQDALPSQLRTACLDRWSNARDSISHSAPASTRAGITPISAARASGAGALAARESAGDRPTGIGATFWLHWGGWVAAAAALLFAVIPTWAGPAGSPSAGATADLRARFDALAALDESERVFWPWSAGGPEFEKVGGHVVWSTSRQEGYLTFENLPENDPTVRQYQLWILDPGRDDEPVDGGVFDVTGDSVVIPIDPALIVVNDVPNGFAVTVEKPGGVVVSTQEIVATIAGPTEEELERRRRG